MYIYIYMESKDGPNTTPVDDVTNKTKDGPNTNPVGDVTDKTKETADYAKYDDSKIDNDDDLEDTPYNRVWIKNKNKR